MRWVRFAVLVIVATILQTSVVGIMAVKRPDITPDLMLILLVFFTIHARRTDAVITSFAIGFAADLISPTTGLIGPQIISFGLFGTLLSDLHNVVSVQRIPYRIGAIFLVGLLTSLLSYSLTFLRSQPIAVSLWTEVLWRPLYSALVGPFLFLPVAWWMRINGKRRSRDRRPSLLR